MTTFSPGRRPSPSDVSSTAVGSCADDAGEACELGSAPVCQFRLAPPRHFAYPALLLLLAEEPRHGYRLVDGLRRFGFGPVSRPSVYRALADLEHDGLLDSWSAEPIAGSTRHMYGLTPAGRQQLDVWMDVLTRERDTLDGVVDRFRRWRSDAGSELDTG